MDDSRYMVFADYLKDFQTDDVDEYLLEHDDDALVDDVPQEVLTVFWDYVDDLRQYRKQGGGEQFED